MWIHCSMKLTSIIIRNIDSKFKVKYLSLLVILIYLCSDFFRLQTSDMVNIPCTEWDSLLTLENTTDVQTNDDLQQMSVSHLKHIDADVSPIEDQQDSCMSISNNECKCFAMYQ